MNVCMRGQTVLFVLVRACSSGVMKARRDVVLGHTFSEGESMTDSLAYMLCFCLFAFFLVRASSCALSPSHVVIPVAGAWISGVARLSFFVCVHPVTSMSLVF